jgi:hypothetical protein
MASDKVYEDISQEDHMAKKTVRMNTQGINRLPAESEGQVL